MNGEASLLLDRMAEAIYYSQHSPGTLCWSTLAPEIRTYYRRSAQMALRALVSSAPDAKIAGLVISDLLGVLP